MADTFVLASDDGADTITRVNKGDTLATLNFDDLLAGSGGGILGIVEEDGNTTVTFTTNSGMVELMTLTGVTGETLNTLLGSSSEQMSPIG